MKKLMFMMFAIAVIATHNSFAGGADEKLFSSPYLKVTGTDKSSVYKMTYIASDSNDVILKIQNEKGEIFYKDYISKGSFIVKLFNLENLPHGNYQFVVSNGKEVKTAELAYGKTSEKDLISVDISKSDEGKYRLTVAGIVKDEVTVKIYDKKSNLITTDKVNINKGFSRLYDLTKVPVDSVKFEVLSSDMTFSKVIQ